MNIQKIKDEILSINWSVYNGPKYYDPYNVADALISLLELKDIKQAEEIGHRVISAIGNDHAGTYYPAVLSALEIIISIEKEPNNKTRKICANSILNNLYYFEPEIGSYSGCTTAQLKEFANNKLEVYSDDNRTED
ncbi:hypothetical protein V2P20_10280 [Methylobacter sp. Wu1]|jgi:hypothetical protein|uniref:hypothetical protein n=1 Tax=Methylobacter sp. Wu1 TaxID=3119359 RepID=UPI002F93E174